MTLSVTLDRKRKLSSSQRKLPQTSRQYEEPADKKEAAVTDGQRKSFKVGILGGRFIARDLDRCSTQTLGHTAHICAPRKDADLRLYCVLNKKVNV